MCSSVLKGLPNMQEALAAISKIKRRQRKKNEVSKDEVALPIFSAAVNKDFSLLS